MTQPPASCSSGQLTLVARGDPIRVSMCHCHACRRRTGSTDGARARFATGDVTIAGDSAEYPGIGGEGTDCHLHACPACGAPWARVPAGAEHPE